MKILMLLVVMLLLLLSLYNNKNKKIYIILSAIVLILYSTFRYYLPGNVVVGNDYVSYLEWFNNINNVDLFKISYILFNLILLVIKNITNNYLVFVFTSSTLFISSAYYFSIKNSNEDNYVMAIFVFLTFGIYELGMSAIRQWIAGSIFLFAITFIKKRDFIKYFISILIAGLIHNSAWVLILVYPFICWKISFGKKAYIAISCTIVLLITTYFKLDYWIATLLVQDFASKYPVFDERLLSNLTIPVISSLCFFGILLFYNRYKKYSANHEFEMNYLLLLVCISFLATTSMIFGRFVQYFLPALVIVIPNITEMFDNNMKRILRVSAVFFLLLIYIL